MLRIKNGLNPTASRKGTRAKAIQKLAVAKTVITATGTSIETKTVTLPSSPTQENFTTTLKNKLDAFGFLVLEIDGHCHKAIRSAATFFKKTHKKPTIILANTIKGKGIRVMENNPEWHHKSPNKSELNKMIKELS